jgi:prepilin-type processing-associated H-X9-DG protein/prepilin-type N-terminal cleavage/methylation domain-containing protein
MRWLSRTFASFTLVEMLVVMAILAVLFGMLIPAMGMARDRGRAAQCMGNLKQIGVTVQVYLDDHSEIFPPAVDYVPWRGSDYPGGVSALVNQKPQDIQACFTNYSLATNSSVWVCHSARIYAHPANPSGLGQFGMPYGWGYRNNITYRWNSYETRSTLSMIPNLADMNKFPKSLVSVRKPSQAALMWDLPDDLVSYGKSLHMGKINCLFVDGHVELITAIPGSSTPDTLWWYVGDNATEGWGY